MSKPNKNPRRDKRANRPSGDSNRHAFNPDAAYGSGGSYLPSGHSPADLLPRAIARLIDGLFVGIPALIVYRVLTDGFGLFGAFLGAILYGITLVLYATIMESESGETLGKRIMKLQVFGPQGGFPSRSEAFRRNSFYVAQAFVMMPFLLVSFIAAAITLFAIGSIAYSIHQSPRRQGRHDEIADGTQVVRV
ncbi:RDD family protein [Hoyosella rhizosphaerae]|uniref:RDD family protein n=1 Tax=Hoyosella rhizosphaerae TaxID=1755582 RepID=A0A916UK88_9ACTN|nr:RDD family protein [Hoyosella rhizosphaerae]MBN4925416.1 RDD family protein [Hoyosella rhizosphaerae]GGC75350.1 RDD family protein [Hoyosella rhizosphaerae]